MFAIDAYLSVNCMIQSLSEIRISTRKSWRFAHRLKRENLLRNPSNGLTTVMVVSITLNGVRLSLVSRRRSGSSRSWRSERHELSSRERNRIIRMAEYTSD
jgi:hypothetical protein